MDQSAENLKGSVKGTFLIVFTNDRRFTSFFKQLQKQYEPKSKGLDGKRAPQHAALRTVVNIGREYLG